VPLDYMSYVEILILRRLRAGPRTRRSWSRRR